MNKHIPVLAQESKNFFLDHLPLTERVCVFVDCTLGGGGHTRILLDAHPNLHGIGIDMDPNAILAASASFHNEMSQGRLELANANFVDFLGKGNQSFDAILMDLGYSSNQLENPEYGMSFSLNENALLDMRLSRRGETAWDILTQSSQTELAGILQAYGEMPGAHRIAAQIVSGIKTGEIQNSTHSLRDFLARKTGLRKSRDLHPATLVFQALRIAVNDELRALDAALKELPRRLKSGGLVAIITFHSLEDRIVKRFFQKNGQYFETMSKKPLIPSETEVKLNARARSAKLRLYKRK